MVACPNSMLFIFPQPEKTCLYSYSFFTGFSKHGVGHGLGLPMALIGSSGVEKIDKYFKNIIITEAHWRPLSIAAYILLVRNRLNSEVRCEYILLCATNLDEFYSDAV